MKTIALTDETAPSRTQSRIFPVFSGSLPQSSALMMSRPVGGASLLLCTESVAATPTFEEFTLNSPEKLQKCVEIRFGARIIGEPIGQHKKPIDPLQPKGVSTIKELLMTKSPEPKFSF